MKKLLVVALLGFVVMAGCARILSPEDDWRCTDQGWVKHGNPSSPMPDWECGQSGKTDSAVEPEKTDEPESVLETAGATKPETGGGTVEDRAESEGDFESPPGVVEGNIVVDSPKPNETVEFPIKVYGKARVFEGQFNWRLLDSSGKEVARGSAMTNGSEMGKYGAYQFLVDKVAAAAGSVVLEVLDYSAKDGSPQDVVSIPLTLKADAGAGLKTYWVSFATTRGNEGMMDCSKTEAVERKIPITKSPAKTVMGLLFEGPTPEEKAAGAQAFWIGAGQANLLKRIFIKNEIAYLDWADLRPVIPNASTSCGSASFFAPVEKTLGQFPGIKKVIHAINGDPGAFYEWMQMGCDEANGNCDTTPYGS